MFRCQQCGTVAAPKTSPVRQTTQTRPKEYVDREGQVIGRGTEIVKEVLLCPSCVGEKPHGSVEAQANLTVKVQVAGFVKHVRSCKEKSPFDCWVCVRIMNFYADLPSKVLNQVL